MLCVYFQEEVEEGEHDDDDDDEEEQFQDLDELWSIPLALIFLAFFFLKVFFGGYPQPYTVPRSFLIWSSRRPLWCYYGLKVCGRDRSARLLDGA